MGTQITRLTRLAAAGLSAVLLFATTACAATSPAETEPDNKTSVPAPTGPINVVASPINGARWPPSWAAMMWKSRPS